MWAAISNAIICLIADSLRFFVWTALLPNYSQRGISAPLGLSVKTCSTSSIYLSNIKRGRSKLWFRPSVTRSIRACIQTNGRRALTLFIPTYTRARHGQRPRILQSLKMLVCLFVCWWQCFNPHWLAGLAVPWLVHVSNPGGSCSLWAFYLIHVLHYYLGVRPPQCLCATVITCKRRGRNWFRALFNGKKQPGEQLESAGHFWNLTYQQTKMH